MTTHKSEWEDRWKKSTMNKNKQAHRNKHTETSTHASECRECFASFWNAKAYPVLRHSFTTQIQNAYPITSMPNIWLSGFCGYKTTWAPRKCVVYRQYNEPQLVLSAWKHIAPSWQKSINYVEENATNLFQKTKAANTLNITADGIYNYHSAKHDLYNSYSIPSCHVASLHSV